MPDHFYSILEEHIARYPLMEAQDCGKLLFQNEFGPEHMVTDQQAVRRSLEDELSEMQKEAGKAVSGEFSPQYPEKIGGGLCRFPLWDCPSVEAAGLLADLFVLTARESQGSVEGLKSKLEQAAVQGFGGIPGMKEWAEDWRKQGYPAVHHSRTYREAYHPHYRLLRKAYAGFFQALWEISRRIAAGEQTNPPFILGLDGRCGSGKTSFASLIAQLFPCNVVHMDDYYLPPEARRDNWKEIPGGNMDFHRFLREILFPAKAGEQVCSQPWQCQKGKYAEAQLLPRQRLLVVEGSYSHHPLLAKQYDLKIFLTCPRQEQRERLRAREGSYFFVFEEQWIPMEERYFQCYEVEQNSHLVVDTGGFWS